MTKPSIIFPAEWAEQESVLLTWPHKNTDWNWILDSVFEFYIGLSLKIRQHCHLIVAVGDPNITDTIESQLQDQDAPFGFTLCEVPSNDTWARDHGPISVYRNGSRTLLDYQFNGWGGKFEAELDNNISQSLCSEGIWPKAELETVDLVLEGGSVESDGLGTILTTSQCLLNPNRNPGLSKLDIEKQLSDQLGAKRVLWLDSGHLEGDDTDAHIDTLARFCSPSVIAYTHTEMPDDSHYDSLTAMEEELMAFQQPDGNPYTLVPLPLPEPIFEDGHRLPATYANFLILNGAVLFPIYNQRTDLLAVEQMKRAMPDHEIVPIDCSVLVRQYGSLHCITMQIPKGTIDLD